MDFARFIWDMVKGIFFDAINLIFTIPALFTSILFFLTFFWSKKGEEKMNRLKKYLQNHRTWLVFIIMIFILASVIRTSYSLYVNKRPIFATPDELTQAQLVNRDIRLSDLTREDFVIRHRMFDNCHFYGPAVIHTKDCVTENILFKGKIESALITTSNTTVSGAILFDSCVLKKCTFHRISFIGSETQIEKIKANIQSSN